MVERVATLLDEQPSLSANQVAALLRLRRQDAQTDRPDAPCGRRPVPKKRGAALSAWEDIVPWADMEPWERSAEPDLWLPPDDPYPAVEDDDAA